MKILNLSAKSLPAQRARQVIPPPASGRRMKSLLMRALARYVHPVLALTLLLVHHDFAQAAKPPIAINLKMREGELDVVFKDQKLMVYAFAEKQLKPYVRELRTLSGENVLRDAPPDHLHHHGLMYAVAVNGINFWEEKDSPGIEKTVGVPSYLVGQNAWGHPEAQFVQVVHWLPPGKGGATSSPLDALLFEQRTLTLTVDERSQEVALRWEAEFELGPKAGKVKLSGANYNGLGLRLPESFNHVAKFQNSANQPYTGNNSQNVIAAKWTSVSGTLGGHIVTLGLFGQPKNARGDGFFFTMLDPFAYLTATQGLDKQPLGYSTGDKFKLSYLLTVYSTEKPRDFIQQRYELWQRNKQ